MRLQNRMLMVPALAGALLASGAVMAQDTASPNTNPAQSQTSHKRQKDTAKKSGESGTQSTDMGSGSSLAAADRRFMMKAAEGGMMEVELGKLAQEKAESDAVKQFGQRMVTDHTKANDELKGLAQQKSYTLPTEMGADGKAMKARLEKMSGAQFDKAYMNHMVKDHVKDVGEFKKQSTLAKDGDLKGWAGKTLPTLQEHLSMAKQVHAQLAGKGAEKQGAKKSESADAH